MTCRVGKVCGFSYDGGYAEYMVAPRRGGGPCARRPDGRGRRAAHVRRHHHLQRAPPLAGTAGRHRRGAGSGRSRTPGRAVRGEVRLPHDRGRARRRQARAGAPARRARVRRRRSRECRRGARGAGRREAGPRDRAERQGDRGHRRRDRPRRPAAPGRRGARADSRLGLRVDPARVGRSRAGRAGMRRIPRTRCASAHCSASGR